MQFRTLWRGAVVISFVALAFAGVAPAADEDTRGIDPNQGRSLVEVHLDSKADAIALQLKADEYGIDFNDHYLRHDANGGVTVTVFGGAEELDALEAAGYELGTTIEGPATWRDRVADRQADVKAENTAEAAALAQGAAEVAPRGDIIVLRVDYFENYAGRFLSVEAKDGTRGSSTTGASLVLSWNTGAGTAIDQGPRTMNVNIDPDTTPDTYIEHRILVKVGRCQHVDAAGADADPDRLEPRSVRRGRREHLARRRAAADELELPQQLHHPLPRPDRAVRPLPRARGGVPGPDDDHPAAEQDERVPAAGAGADGRV